MSMEDGSFGDLVIAFDIYFPKNLTSKQIEQVISIISSDGEKGVDCQQNRSQQWNGNWSQYLWSNNLFSAQKLFNKGLSNK